MTRSSTTLHGAMLMAARSAGRLLERNPVELRCIGTQDLVFVLLGYFGEVLIDDRL